MGDRVAVLITDRHEVDRYNLPATEISVQPRLFAFMGVDKHLGKLAFPLKDIPAEHAVIRCGVLACTVASATAAAAPVIATSPAALVKPPRNLRRSVIVYPKIEYRSDSSRF